MLICPGLSKFADRQERQDLEPMPWHSYLSLGLSTKGQAKISKCQKYNNILHIVLTYTRFVVGCCHIQIANCFAKPWFY